MKKEKEIKFRSPIIGFLMTAIKIFAREYIWEIGMKSNDKTLHGTETKTKI